MPRGIMPLRMSPQGLAPSQETSLRAVVSRYMAKCDGLDSHCSRCLATQRWSGSVTLMLVDAAFMSIGLNYFTAVVPVELTKRPGSQQTII